MESVKLFWLLVPMYVITGSHASDRKLGLQEELRVTLDSSSPQVLRVYCVASLPEDREMFVRSRMAQITVDAGEDTCKGKKERKELRNRGWKRKAYMRM